MNYFAYGSNMLTKRLTDRVSGATKIAVARVIRRRLAFHKRSTDGSGKCDIPAIDDLSSIVYGVLFNIPKDQFVELDRHEGVGYGYIRRKVEVVVGSRSLSAQTYLATEDAIDAGLVPYDWYHRLVLEGAREHGLPRGYIADIAAVAAKVDPNPNRKTRLNALKALGD